jgi:two-component system, NtrC family, nitrogen regulation sensor histidine kinase NtrY
MKNFRLNLIIRVILLTLSIILFSYIFFNTEYIATLVILILIIIYQIFALIRYIDSTNKELARFLQSIKYSDFSQTFSKKFLGSSFEELNTAFNEVMLKFQKTRTEKEEHYRYLQTVMQHVGVGLISYNLEGKVEFINNAAKKILNISYLNNIEMLNNVTKGLGTSLLTIKAGEKSTLKIADENELIQLIVYATEFKMRDQLYTLISLQNIQSELEEKEMESWQKLIRVLTHEIMNSITPISSLAATVNYMLEKEDNPADGVKDETINDIKVAVNTIQKRSEGLLHFVDDYRNLTKIPKPNFQIFPIKNLFERIEKLMENKLKENNINFSKSIEPESLEITADPELIEQVLINLLINSIQAVAETKDPIITMMAHLDDRGKITLRIADNGPGISDELQEKIFIPFFSTKKNGSGIGLSLSRQIMRSHGGSIRISSYPDKETAFTLKF